MEIINSETEDYHIHSLNFSDGMNTVDEIVKYAGEIGLTKIAITDHCQMHLDNRKFHKKNHYNMIERWKNVHNNVEVIFGIEDDILNEDGDVSMDIQRTTSQTIKRTESIMKKHIVGTLLILLTILFNSFTPPTFVYAQTKSDSNLEQKKGVVLQQLHPPSAPQDAANPLLVWDVAAAERKGLPRNFRTTSDQFKSKDGKVPSTMGLQELQLSGSGEYTVTNLKLMLDRISKHVTIFDLRQEDHIFVNGEPVSWYATNNWANVGKSNETIMAGEKERIASIKIGTTLSLGDAKSKKGEVSAPIENVTVSTVCTEEDAVKSAGASYVRVTVSDHARPLDGEVDRFIKAVRALPADSWVHMHCRAGKGRTTTFMALYDMLRNANKVSLDDIIQRQSLLIGDYDLLAIDADGGKAGVGEDRAVFVRTFYDYARANPNGQPQLWSEWLMKK